MEAKDEIKANGNTDSMNHGSAMTKKDAELEKSHRLEQKGKETRNDH